MALLYKGFLQSEECIQKCAECCFQQSCSQPATLLKHQKQIIPLFPQSCLLRNSFNSFTLNFLYLFRTFPVAACAVKQCVSSLKASNAMVSLFTVHDNTIFNYQIVILDPLTKSGITFFTQGGFWCLFSWLQLRKFTISAIPHLTFYEFLSTQTFQASSARLFWFARPNKPNYLIIAAT